MSRGWPSGPQEDDGRARGTANANTASAAQLDALPGVGPRSTTALVAHRSEHGPFESIDEVLDVPGREPADLASIRDRVEIGP